MRRRVLPNRRTGKDLSLLMETLLLPLLLLAVFWFILIRPQQKQRREIAEVQSNLAPGARVMTGSGLIGTIVSVEADEVVLEVAPGVTNRYVRRAIMRVLSTDDVALTPPPGTEDSVTESDLPPGTDAGTRPSTDRTNRDDVPGTSP
jgi:preprotein translocase subunit YajC